MQFTVNLVSKDATAVQELVAVHPVMTGHSILIAAIRFATRHFLGNPSDLHAELAAIQSERRARRHSRGCAGV